MIPNSPGPLGETPVLLVIDPQSDFLNPDGAVYCPSSSVSDTETVVENIQTLVSSARNADIPIVWTKESHRHDMADYGAELLSAEVEQTVAGTHGEQFITALDVSEGELPPAYDRSIRPIQNSNILIEIQCQILDVTKHINLHSPSKWTSMVDLNNASLIGASPALLVIDPQNDFLHSDGDLYCSATSNDQPVAEVVSKINRLVETARNVDIPVIWSKESHRHDGTDRGTELLWENATHTGINSWGEEFYDNLAVDEDSMRPGEYIVTKRRYNLFHGTDLEHLLKTFETDTVILTGVTTSVCVHYTAQGALERDYVFRTIKECTAEETAELHESGLRCQNNIQPGGVQPFARILDEMESYSGNPVVNKLKSDGKITNR